MTQPQNNSSAQNVNVVHKTTSMPRVGEMKEVISTEEPALNAGQDIPKDIHSNVKDIEENYQNLSEVKSSIQGIQNKIVNNRKSKNPYDFRTILNQLHSLQGGSSKSASEGFIVKKASSKEECIAIMSSIFKENPEHWPNGLYEEQLDDLYLIREPIQKRACGFVGWQEIPIHKKIVGYYSIGILPEYRNNGFAKEAVAQLIHEKSAGVDEVKAAIVNSNVASKALANSLSIPIQIL